MISMARDLDLLTTPYVFTKEDAIAMTRAGADIIVCHMGLTTSGSIGAQTSRTLEDCVPIINEMVEAAKGVRSDVLVLCHGGPIAMPDDANYILKHCPGIVGFYGASSMERLPTEVAIRDQVKAFTALKIGGSN